MKILVVEDDPELLEPIHTALTRAGHTVDGADTSETAAWLLREQAYDLVILDWMLPTGSGIQLCQHYRQLGKTSPVLMLTARHTVRDKITGLDAGPCQGSNLPPDQSAGRIRDALPRLENRGSPQELGQYRPRGGRRLPPAKPPPYTDESWG